MEKIQFPSTHTNVLAPYNFQYNLSFCCILAQFQFPDFVSNGLIIWMINDCWSFTFNSITDIEDNFIVFLGNWVTDFSSDRTTWNVPVNLPPSTSTQQSCRCVPPGPQTFGVGQQAQSSVITRQRDEWTFVRDDGWTCHCRREMISVQPAGSGKKWNEFQYSQIFFSKMKSIAKKYVNN